MDIVHQQAGHQMLTSGNFHLLQCWAAANIHSGQEHMASSYCTAVLTEPLGIRILSPVDATSLVWTQEDEFSFLETSHCYSSCVGLGVGIPQFSIADHVRTLSPGLRL